MDIAVYVIIAALIVFSQYLKDHWVSKRLLKKAKKKLVLPETWQVVKLEGDSGKIGIIKRLENVRKIKRYYTNRLYISINQNRNDKKSQARVNALEESIIKRFNETREGVLVLTINDPEYKDFAVYYNENINLDSFLEETFEKYKTDEIAFNIEYDPFWKAYAAFNKQMKNAKK